MKQILQIVLQISDSQHRQKIKLRAMDVVLFGPSNGGELCSDTQAKLLYCIEKFDAFHWYRNIVGTGFLPLVTVSLALLEYIPLLAMIIGSLATALCI